MRSINEAQALGEFINSMLARLEGSNRWSLSRMRAVLEETILRTKSAARAEGRPFSCQGAGCCGCCRGEVAVLPKEIEPLLLLVSDDSLRDAWDRRAELTHPQRQRLALCPLLDKKSGNCTVYEERPLVCRGYHAVSPRDWCWPERSGPKPVSSYPEPLGVVGAIHADTAISTRVMSRSLSEVLVEEAFRRGLNQGENDASA